MIGKKRIARYKGLLPKKDTLRAIGTVHFLVHDAEGNLIHQEQGRNKVTAFLDNGDGLLSGCDVARRRLVGSSVLGGLSSADYCPAAIELGTGSRAAVDSDNDLETPLADSRKEFTQVAFSESENSVTFTARWTELEANADLAEAMLRSARDVADGRGDPLSRYVFATTFAKSSSYTFTLNWTWRF